MADEVKLGVAVVPVRVSLDELDQGLSQARVKIESVLGGAWQKAGAGASGLQESVAGATAAVLLIVQYTKGALDKILKIPTRLYAYIVAVAILLLAQGFTAGLSWSDLPLLLLNALIVATAAYGSYEITFAKVDRSA